MEERIPITAFLTAEQIKFLDDVAQQRGVRGRQAPLRWAIDHYRAFLLGNTSTYRTDRDAEEPAPADIAK